MITQRFNLGAMGFGSFDEMLSSLGFKKDGKNIVAGGIMLQTG